MNKFLYFVAAAHLCCDINSGALPALLPFFVSEYGMDYSSAGGLIFAKAFFGSVLQPYFGYVADKTSRRWYIPLGVLLAGGAFALTGFTRSYWLIFSLVIIMGLGSALFHPEAARFINLLSGDKRASGMSIFSLGGNGGFGLGPLAAVAVVTAFGMKGVVAFGILSIVMSTTLFLAMPFLEKEARRQQAIQKENKDRIEAEERSCNIIREEKPKKNDWRSFSYLTIFITFRSIVANGINSFLPLFCVTVLMVSNGVGSTTLTVLSIAGIFATLIGGYLADRFGFKKVLQIGSFILVPVMLGIALIRDIRWIYFLMIPLSLGLNGTYSSFVVLGQSYLAKNIGFASGVTLGLSATIGGIAAPLFGYYADKHGLYPVMLILAVVAFGAFLSSFFLKKPEL